MRQNINGQTYDTEIAAKIGETNRGNLYRTRLYHYFLAEKDGIFVFNSIMETVSWAARNLNLEDFDAEFGDLVNE